MLDLNLDLIQQGYQTLIIDDEKLYKKIEEYIINSGIIETIVKPEDIEGIEYIINQGRMLFNEKEKLVAVKNVDFKTFNNLLDIINGEN